MKEKTRELESLTNNLTFKDINEMTEDEIQSQVDASEKYLKQLKEKQKEFNEKRKQEKIKSTQSKINYINKHEEVKKFLLENIKHYYKDCSDKTALNGFYYSDNDLEERKYHCPKCALLELLNNCYAPDFDFDFEVNLTFIK